jgi:hypothetical protein
VACILQKNEEKLILQNVADEQHFWNFKTADL